MMNDCIGKIRYSVAMFEKKHGVMPNAIMIGENIFKGLQERDIVLRKEELPEICGLKVISIDFYNENLIAPVLYDEILD